MSSRKCRSRELIQGLMIGIVTSHDDPDDQGRAKVNFPALTGEDESDWVRVVNLTDPPRNL
ncbi:phage baseplate assembly protein V [Deinococcus taklimakanensis]|uniref:Phage baseplate assembly protein V n=1 Tax=Deinococcus taklimakanensis TaxID=536443 RepID=A0ABW5P1F7_9DEIO